MSHPCHIEDVPEQPTLTVLATKVSQASPLQPVMVTEAMSETPAVAVVSPEAAPEQPVLGVLAMEAIPEALIQPVMATEAISEHPALPGSSAQPNVGFGP
ncbi:hypothetical protein ROHU_012917 [Labeo rohita]|uniref:Uncharacterized protein n=1 Tax=Labeo rohita TaxID=84645 RepID=A0A498LC80_LABRO|nr:hypothetical protein ROHU_012917 [Labeo rohita]